MIVAYKYLEDDFAPGEQVAAESDHLEGLDGSKKKAELAIRAADPRGPLRARAIYAFERREIAEDLLGQTGGKNLYEVEIDEGDVMHRADLRIYDEIEEALGQDEPVDRLAGEFWSGAERPAPRIELAVRKITVRRKIVDKGEASLAPAARYSAAADPSRRAGRRRAGSGRRP